MIKEEHLYYPDGRKKAILVHTLKSGECPCKWEKRKHHFTQGNKVYRRIINVDDENFTFPTDLDNLK